MTDVFPLILTGVILSVCGQTCLKSGMNRIGEIPSLLSRDFALLPVRAARQPYILAGVPLYVTAALVWLMVLSRVDLSYAYPFLGLNYVLVALSSRLILGEHVNWLRWVGVFVILIGVAIDGTFG